MRFRFCIPPTSLRTFRIFLIAGILLAVGCRADSDYKVIDFSRILAVKQPGRHRPPQPLLRVAVAAMISPRETFGYYRQLLDYIGRHTQREVQFIQRKTYAEINELLGRGQIDLAFICSGPYAADRQKYGFQLLVSPQVQGRHFYRSYLIVNRDSSYQRLADLKGHIFAFTDPDSNSGKLVPTYWLAENQARPKTFFSRTIYTYSHDNSILAVSRKLVDGAAVDGLIWEYYHRRKPGFTARTRVIRRSEPYGMPPIVVSKYLAPQLKAKIGQLFLNMHRDVEGQKILRRLMIERFVTPRDAWYDSIRKMDLALAASGKEPHAPTQP